MSRRKTIKGGVLTPDIDERISWLLQSVEAPEIHGDFISPSKIEKIRSHTMTADDFPPDLVWRNRVLTYSRMSQYVSQSMPWLEDRHVLPWIEYIERELSAESPKGSSHDKPLSSGGSVKKTMSWTAFYAHHTKGKKFGSRDALTAHMKAIRQRYANFLK